MRRSELSITQRIDDQEYSPANLKSGSGNASSGQAPRLSIAGGRNTGGVVAASGGAKAQQRQRRHAPTTKTDTRESRRSSGRHKHDLDQRVKAFEEESAKKTSFPFLSPLLSCRRKQGASVVEQRQVVVRSKDNANLGKEDFKNEEELLDIEDDGPSDKQDTPAIVMNNNAGDKHGYGNPDEIATKGIVFSSKKSRMPMHRPKKKKEGKPISMEAAKELLTQRTSPNVVVYEPFLASSKERRNEGKTQPRRVSLPLPQSPISSRAVVASGGGTSGGGRLADNRTMMSTPTRQELSKINKERLKEWLDFALGEIRDASVHRIDVQYDNSNPATSTTNNTVKVEDEGVVQNDKGHRRDVVFTDPQKKNCVGTTLPSNGTIPNSSTTKATAAHATLESQDSGVHSYHYNSGCACFDRD